MTQRASVFVGSSSEGLLIAKALQTALGDLAGVLSVAIRAGVGGAAGHGERAGF